MFEPFLDVSAGITLGCWIEWSRGICKERRKTNFILIYFLKLNNHQEVDKGGEKTRTKGT